MSAQPGSAAIPIEVSETGRTACPDVIAITGNALLVPDIMPRMLQTQVAYRLLTTSGISSADAAGLIAYVLGLPQCESRWSLHQINRFLFLRSMYNDSRWGEAERQPE
jgi:hypothetical protein